MINEALSAGCHVVASEFTGLRDLMLPEVLGTQIEGEITTESIAKSLTKAMEELSMNRDKVFFEAKRLCQERSWTNYRKRVVEFAQFEKQSDEDKHQ